MTPAEFAWLVGLIAVLLFALLLHRRRVTVPRARHLQLVRSPEHQAQIQALKEWLQEPRICRAFLDGRLATVQGLQQTFEDADGFTAEEAQATIGLLLSRRDTRLVVAGWMQKKYGHPKAEVLRALIEWATPVKEQLAQAPVAAQVPQVETVH